MEEITRSWPGWEVVRKIGSGSFGTVYEIKRDMFGKIERAALKVLSIPESREEIDELYSDGYDDESITTHYKEYLGEIIREYSLMLEMKGHTNVVYCDDVKYIQHDDGIGWDIYIKMELLTPLTKTVGEYNEAQAVRLGIDLCSALILCRQEGIVHRDIKPQNIFVSKTGDYKLGDFGVAKVSDKTATGTKVGTFDYMAPEVYRGQAYGCGADIYSLGLVLYWMMNQKRTPFLPLPPQIPSASAKEEARNRRFAGEALPEPVNGSDALKAIVRKACAADPKERYATAAEMQADLKKLNTEAAFIPPVVPEPEEAPTEKIEPADKTVNIFGARRQNAAPEVAEEKTEYLREEKNKYLKEEKTEYIPRAEAPQEQPRKKNRWLIPVIAGVAAIILILLLLRSCGGNSPAASTEPSGTTTGETTTAPTTQATTPTTEATTAPTTEGTTGPTTPYQAEWSGWLDSLPEYVSADNYIIEELTLYRSRELETTTSTTETAMDGWEHYDTVEADGGYGPWSDWSGTAVTASNTRQVETQLRYRYRNKEYTTGSSATKSGWTLYNTTYTWSSYGSWSGWTTTKYTASTSRKVETKTQYSYRTKTVTQEYTDWGAWSDWQDTAVSEDNYTDVETRTVWAYYYYLCHNCGDHMHGYDSCFTWAGGCGTTYIRDYHKIWSTIPWSDAGLKDWYGTGKQYTYIDGELVFKHDDTATQYRYRTRSLQDVTYYSSWSAYSDTKYTASSTREVRTRTMYRYCDRSQIPTYHFWRWGSWSGWTATAVSGNDSRQVENTTYYRYRDQITTTTYCFRRWKDWSEYSEIAVSPSETVEVETKTQYRFKSKEN